MTPQQNKLLTILKNQLLQALKILGIIKSQQIMTPFQKFCAAIIQYEGANPANNNPFNDKYYFGGYLSKYGIVKESVGGFAIFETLELGTEYGTTIITQMIDKHPEWNFYDFFGVYAPTKDKNNPVRYAQTIAAEVGVEPTANLKSTLNI